MLRFLALAVALVWPATSFAQSEPPPRQVERGEERTQGLPPGIDIEYSGTLRTTETGDYAFDGPVTLVWRDSRIHADRLSLREGRFLEAEGNVLLVWAESRLFGSRLAYDLETERGQMTDVTGEVLGEYQFRAERLEKIGERLLHLESATITTCTQPLPYWSLAVSSATIRIGGYARMWNVRLEAGRVPIVYFPYLVWPVKEGRAAGLLLPDVHTTRTRGRAISEELFVPLGRSADLTLLGRYYTKAGFGSGGELRVIPNDRGEATLNGFFIQDEVAGAFRYRATHRQTQEFQNGFRMLADINLVSDPEYFTDFERELSLVSTPSILARVEFSRNGRWTSLNVREVRREQLLSNEASLVQQALPEIEWRGRSRRVPRTPLYVSFESSLASIQQHGLQQGNRIDADYLRGDLFPTISLPWSPTRWLDITPRARYRMTYYTQHQREVDGQPLVVDDPLTRTLGSYGVDLVGPKLFRIWGPEDESRPRYKHAIEPRVSYAFEENFPRTDEILLYDNDVDRASGFGDRLSYGLVQRVFARRPQSALPAAPGPAEPVVLPDGEVVAPDSPTPPAVETLTPAPGAPLRREPVEIASLELSQARTFDRDQSFADLDADGIDEATSPYSPIQLVGRYNPSPLVSVDLRSSWHILYDKLSSLSLSGNLRNRRSFLRFSLVHQNGLGLSRTTVIDPSSEEPVVTLTPREDSTQVRLTSGMSLLSERLQFEVDTTYDAHPGMERKHFPNKRWRLQYSTQCCTFYFERLSYDFASIEDRRDFYFRVDLRGVGKILDINY